DTVYTFTILNERFKRYRLPEVGRVERDGRTIFDREICEVHHQTMERKRVRIIYGLIRPGPSAPSSEIERSHFPHRREVTLGGCVSGMGTPRSARVFVCTASKAAYANWRAHNATTANK